ncbi:MAG: PaaI family thioesterase [Alcanivorax sp.]|nr:PaaI family thioesterase [Alcanivorax sp.]
MSHFDQVVAEVLAQPFHRACELALLEAGDGRSEIGFAVNEFTRNPAGVLHGGILYALLDVGCFLAVMTRLNDDQHAVTVETHTSVLRAAQAGEQVVIRAAADRLGRTLAAMRAEAFAVTPAGEERLIATGSVTKAVLQGRQH